MKNKPLIQRESERFWRAGFTMVEILAVITVIAILMSVASVGIQKMDAGQATGTAAAVSEAIFDEARGAAVGRGTRARVVIHNDPRADQRDRFLRYMAVCVEVEDGATMTWKFPSRGTTLPSGVFFDEDATLAATTTVPELGTYGTMIISLPGQRNNLVDCIYYEFNSEGVCVDGGVDGDTAGASPGAAFVLAGGVLPPNEDKPRVKGNNRTGFVVWRNGRSSIFRNPDHITPN